MDQNVLENSKRNCTRLLFEHILKLVDTAYNLVECLKTVNLKGVVVYWIVQSWN